MLKKNYKTKNGGYAILFTVVVVGIISMITIGLANSAYKQTVLSSVARDSATAFYQADIGSECALYADKMDFFRDDQTLTEFNCAGYNLRYAGLTSDGYNLSPENEISSAKCFRINVVKTNNGDALLTDVVSKGYNICNKSKLRTVERGIKVSY